MARSGGAMPRRSLTFMAASNIEESTARPLPSVAGRLRDGRWVLAVVGIALLLLLVLGAMGAAAASVTFIVTIAAVALAPRSNSAERLASRSEPAQPVWPETGIKRFAEALPDPCFVLDRRGVVRYANERALNAFPIRTGESLTFRLRAPDLVAAFDRVAKGGPAERVEFAERVPTAR